ncbi:flagellar hook-associated protein FlgK (plasmid) [Pontibacillus sp. ALD_SL1]|uniref:flagellar hook-associated protein FlgK n=1 Tax=Pontibacillus sp. ALD_SL1 TaxID=2777185 RepID=UPI001A96A5EB|nr:flagellar hook-associated protein FlgK [Pontibacillus sp. ALD_SL1]QST03024.1 flagellar hook-associated protein FlgK [Pontibacillus sp. ALD_SL1]
MGFSFDISQSGLLAARRGINVAQNNIANANTDGYARERLELAPNTTNSGATIDGQIGSGVVTKEVVRLVDELMLQQSRHEMGQTDYFSSMRQHLSNLESVFSETKEGSVSALLSQFYYAYEELAKYPEQHSYRLSLVGQAERLAEKFNSIQEKMSQMRSEVDQTIEVKRNKINELVDKIANVNDRIGKTGGGNANALMDERDRYINELSVYGGVVVEQSAEGKGIVNVRFGEALLVSGTRGNRLEMMEMNDGEIVLHTGSVTARVEGGSLAADLDFRNRSLPQYNDTLNLLVGDVIANVNGIHATGYGLDNTTGEPFFLGGNAGSIAVNTVLKQAPEKVATSSVAGAEGNNDIARQIASLRTSPTLNGGTTSPVAFYDGFSIQMASDLHIAKDNEKVHEAILLNVNEQKEAVQGVNTDEEMTNLMMFQQYYQANAKAISIIKESLDALMRMI